KLEDWPIYRAIRHLVMEGGDLRDTDYFDNGKRNICYFSGGIWFRVTERNWEKETKRILQIHEGLVREGYRSQREIGSRRILDEVRVRIGRGGELLFENSIHRMVLSRILDLDSIPVVVTIRHAEWDGLR